MAAVIRKLLPFGLLVPAAFLLTAFIGTLFGFEAAYGTRLSLLLGAAAWTLLFLIIYGHSRSWKSVRLFLVVFVAGKFCAILYYQVRFGIRLDQLLLRLSAAVVVAWIMFGIFWPRVQRPFKSGA